MELIIIFLSEDNVKLKKRKNHATELILPGKFISITAGTKYKIKRIRFFSSVL